MGVTRIDADEQRTDEVTDLLQQLIRNACVNDGTPGTGGESRSADLLADYLDGSAFDVERYEPEPGRASLVARLEQLALGLVDAMPERGVDDDRQRGMAVLIEERTNRLVELSEARRGTTFGRDVRAVHDDVVGGHG